MNEQNKRARVIKALKCRSQSGKRCGNPCEETGACEYAYLITDPDGEPYYPFLCNKEKLCNDAIELLKAQEPKVLTLEEVKRLQSLKDGAVWIETFGGAVLPALPEILASHISYFVAIPFNNYRGWVENEYYGKTWRCWSARPTEEQREAVPWKE